jgi:serpin B
MLRSLPALLSAAVLAFGCTKKENAPAPAPDKPTPHASPDAAPPAHVDMPAAADVAPLAKASNAFGVDLYGQLRARPGNLALSPASISIALAMTWGGAKGDTAAQLRKVLHLDGDPATVGAAWGKLAGALQDPARPLTLRIANRLSASRASGSSAVLDATAAATALLEPLDLVHAVEAQRVHINGWVADRTAQRITNLLPPASPTTRPGWCWSTRSTADWASPFESRRDVRAAVPPDGDRRRLDDDDAPAGDPRRPQGGVSVLAMPYRGATRRWIVLPDVVDGSPTSSGRSTRDLDGWRGAGAPPRCSWRCRGS